MSTSYRLDAFATVTLRSRGRYSDTHKRIDVKGTDRDGNVYRSWITVPFGWDEDSTVGAAIDAIASKYADATGDDTGSEWNLYAEDIGNADHVDSAAMYRVNGVSHYRLTSYTHALRSEDMRDDTTFPTLEAVKNHMRGSYWHPVGESEDVYVNDSDEPTYRLTVGPRGGIQVERH